MVFIEKYCFFQIYVCILFLMAIIFLIYVHAFLLKGLSSYRPFALFEPSHKKKFLNSEDEVS
jgi:hypothetical protein